MTKERAKGTEFIVVWEFRVRPGKGRYFEKIYGPDGVWGEFFRRGKGYIRTELIRDLKMPRRYLTVDVWTSREACLRFKRKNRIEYQAIDKRCGALTEDEVKIGEFHSAVGQKRLRP
jgi:heme-degrading monooxygenase HmoA